MEIFTLWLWPLLALILLPGLLVYFGLHVVERGIIFVDLALAQIAALGICVAIALGAHPGHDALPYVLSVVFTLLGAGLFAWTRFNHPRVPQESIIGIIYVVSAAAATWPAATSASEAFSLHFGGNQGRGIVPLGVYFCLIRERPVLSLSSG